MSVAILKNNVEADNNTCDESRGTGFDEREKVENIGSKNRGYKKAFMIVSCEYKIWYSCDGGMAHPKFMQSLESGVYVLIIFYVKLRIRVYEFLRWKLVILFVFCIWYESAMVIIVISVHPIVFGRGVY